MKRLVLWLLTAALLFGLTVPASAAGDSSDPLISVSYVEDTFLPGLRSTLRALAQRLAAERQSSGASRTVSPQKTGTLSPGAQFTIGAGQQLVLLSGGVRLKVEKGTLLNVTLGRESIGGNARTGNRYLVCGGSAVTVTALSAAAVSVSSGTLLPGETAQPAPAGECPFTDTPKGAWYYEAVLSACKKGIINGVSADSFAPDRTVTWAEVVKLVACMHQLTTEGSVTLTSPADGRAWYADYADYALQKGLLSAAPPDYTAVMQRGDFVKLFYGTFPESDYKKINLIMDGAIPDVPTDSAMARQVYTFYEAGVLTGFAAGNSRLDHAFGGDSTVTRAEVAVIMDRLLTPAHRVSFTMD